MENDRKDKNRIDMGFNSHNFVNSVYSLRNFAVKIGSIASKEDENIIKSFSENLANHLGITDHLKQLNEEMLKKQELLESLDKNDENNKSIIDELKLEIEKEQAKTNSEIKDIINKNFENDTIKNLVLKELIKVTKKSPSHSNLLRVGALTTLLSIFENLFSELIRFFYYKYPNALPSDARVLTLTELKAMGSIEEAEIFITSKEVESILRGSFEDQIAFFEKKIKIDISSLSNMMDSLTEIFQRRNLLVHNGGIVNNIYLNKVIKDLSDKYNAKLGLPLKVTESYLLESIDIILLTGLLISQLCWRKWQKEEKEKADDIVLDILYDALIDENYELNISISKFFSCIEFSSDYICKVASINVAIALKQLNRINEMENLLAALDWSSASLKFEIALKALRNQTVELVDLIPKAISIKELSSSVLLDWPLFKEFRLTTEYRDILNIIST